MMLVQQLHDGRQVLAQHQLGRADPDLGRRGFAKLRAKGFEVLEERPHISKQLLPFGGESERTALKQLRAEVFLEQQDLAADGGLLDAVGNMAHGAADASVLRDMVKQLQMMNIHHVWQRTGHRPGRNVHPGRVEGCAFALPGSATGRETRVTFDRYWSG